MNYAMNKAMFPRSLVAVRTIVIDLVGSVVSVYFREKSHGDQLYRLMGKFDIRTEQGRRELVFDNDPLDPTKEKNWQYHDEYEFWYMPYPGTDEAQAEQGVRARGFKPWESMSHHLSGTEPKDGES